MNETKTTAKPGGSAGKFETPKFEMPKFEMPKLDLPAGFREFAETGVAQAKEAYEKARAAAEETNDAIEEACTTAARGVAEYQRKVLDLAQANVNAAFDYARSLLYVNSASEMAELSSAHARQQYDTMAEQTKSLAALAQKVAADTAEPITSHVGGALKKSR